MIVMYAYNVHPTGRGDLQLGDHLRPHCTLSDNVQMLRAPAALLAALTCASCAPELNWRELRADDIGLAQMFPCKPVRQQRQVQLAGRDLTLVLQVCDAGDVTWARAYGDVGDPAAVGAALDGLSLAAHSNLGAQRDAAVAHSVAGASPNAAAGRFQIQGRAPDGKAMQAVVLVFAKGTRVFQLTALGAKLPAEAVETFIASARAGP